MRKGRPQTILLLLAAFLHISVHGCPTNCTCRPDDRVDCQHGHLTNIPTDIPRGTAHLHLQYNRIHSLGPDAFQFSIFRRLRTLELSHNELVSIHPDAFRQQDSVLELLDLSNNNLSSLLPYTFDMLYQLKHLHLQGNNLPIIDQNTFNGLRSLQVLNLQDNDISMVAPNLFQHLPTLVDLSLRSNQLGYLHDRTFEGLSSLRTLDLSRNRIIGLENDVFFGLDNLNNLRLDFNRLTMIPDLPETWFPRNCLKRLNLSHNPIETITDHALGLAIELEELYVHDLPELSTVENFAFRGLPKLQQLHMCNNPGLQTLPEHVFFGLTRIRHINVRNNSFNAIGSIVPKSLELHEVDMSDNPWDCSCENDDFREWLKRFDSHGDILNDDRLLCRYPAELEGEELLSIPEDYCNDGHDSEEEKDGEREEEEYREEGSEEDGPSRGNPEPEPEPDEPEVPCSHDACLMQGQCSMRGDLAYCRCPRPYRGSYCERYGEKGKLKDISAESKTETTIDVSWTVKQNDNNTTFLVYWSVNGPMQYKVTGDLHHSTNRYRITGLDPGSFHRVCIYSNRYNFEISHKCKDLGTLGYSGENPWQGDDSSMFPPPPPRDPFKIVNIGKAIGIGGGVVILIGIMIGVACRIRYLRRTANTEPEAPPEYNGAQSREPQFQLQDLPPPYHEVVNQGFANPTVNPGSVNPGFVHPDHQQRDNTNRSSNNMLNSAPSLPTISEENEGGPDMEQHRK